eukprot:COSAG06_NODE_4634_length_4082_cov_3.759729_5_plen_94_part_00
MVLSTTQVLLSGILLAVPPDVLRTVPGVKQLVESILPYSERHFARLERLHKASFLLDYTLRAMKTAVPVRKTPLFAPFIYKNDHFTKTGSGQT